MTVHKLASPSMENLRIPPHSIEAEQSVVGSVLLNNEAFDKVADLVTPESFYDRSHALIYKAMTEMLTTNKRVDLITLSTYLEDQNELEEAGGFGYLGELSKNTPSAANCRAYAKVMRDKYILRNLIEAGVTLTETAYFTEGQTPLEILGNTEQQLSKVADSLQQNTKDLSFNAAQKRAFDVLEERNKNGSSLLGIRTHLPDLDKLQKGLKKSAFVIVAARPAMGKTTFALNLVETETLNGGNVLVFSLEMPEEQLINKIWSSVGNINHDRLLNPQEMEDEDWTNHTVAVSKLCDKNLRIIDDSYQTPISMKLATNKFKKEVGNPTLIVVDYIQLMNVPGKENRTQEISEISRSLKALAKDFDCPVVGLSQLSRDLEKRTDKRPIQADLRESGQLEQDADEIIMLYRDEVYHENSPDVGLAEVLLRKCRLGKIGKVGAVFRGEKSAFRPLATGQQIEAEPRTNKASKGFNPND